MGRASDYKEILQHNRDAFMAILMMPVIGMVVAIPLIIWKNPKAVTVAIPIILFLIVQYVIMVLWILKKMDQMIKS